MNVIVGSSDSGKSSIIRALKWAVFNTAPANLHSDFSDGKSTSVTVETDEHTVARTKEKWNGYVLDGKEFKAIGKGVPDEVADALNLDSINIQNQHDATFLLSKSPGDIGKYLNEIVDLESIGEVVSHLHGRRLVVGQDLTRADERIESLEASVESYAFLDSVQQCLVEAEKKQGKLTEWKDFLGDLQAVYAGWKKSKARLDVLPRTDEAKEALKGLDALLERRKAEEERLSALVRVRALYERSHAKVEKMHRVTGVSELVTFIEDLQADIGHQRSHMEKMRVIQKRYDGAVFRISKVEKEMDPAIEAYDRLVEELGHTCPVCGGVLEGRECVE